MKSIELLHAAGMLKQASQVASAAPKPPTPKYSMLSTWPAAPATSTPATLPAAHPLSVAYNSPPDSTAQRARFNAKQDAAMPWNGGPPASSRRQAAPKYSMLSTWPAAPAASTPVAPKPWWQRAASGMASAGNAMLKPIENMGAASVAPPAHPNAPAAPAVVATPTTKPAPFKTGFQQSADLLNNTAL